MKDLIDRRERGRKISDLAGTWNVTGKEFKEMKAQSMRFGKNGPQQPDIET